MKNFRNGFNIFLIALICIPNLEALEVKFANELNFEVNRVYPYIIVNKTNLNDVKKLSDVYARYESSWVKSYISVVISTCVKGNIKSESSKNDILTREQKVLMAAADAGAPIHVHVNYMPENTLKHNDPKDFQFSFTIEPEKEAKYPGGQAALMTYLKENAIDKIPANTFVNYDLAAIKFTISEDGKVFNAKIFGQEYPKSYDTKFDHLLLESIQNMPNWIPAEYADGSKAKQEYVLTVGNMENCIINLLNIRPDGRSAKG